MSAPWYLRIDANTAPTRLRYLRDRAVNSPGKTWRDVRSWTLSNWERAHCALSNGGNSWYCHTGPYFRHERPAHEVANLRHTGWYGDTEHCERIITGFVASLPHGRFLAGLLQEDNNERVYFPKVFDDEKEAAFAADEEARVWAEKEDEYQQKFWAADKLDTLIEAKLEDVKNWRELRSMLVAAAYLAPAGRLRNNLLTKAAAEKELILSTIQDIRELRVERKSIGEV